VLARPNKKVHSMLKSLCKWCFRALTISAIVFGGVLLASPQTKVPSAEEWEWTDKAYEKLLDGFLPVRGDTGFYVSFRATPSLHAYEGEAPEWCVFIGPDPKPRAPGVNDFVSAQLRIADSVSIYDQIMTMHRMNPEESLESIRLRIKVKSLEFTEKSCPDIKSLFQGFEKLRFSLPEMGVKNGMTTIFVDPPVYDFHVQASAGNADITLYDRSHPLVVWGMKLERKLQRCAAAENRQDTKR
jgi:hypothetical protein